MPKDISSSPPQSARNFPMNRTPVIEKTEHCNAPRTHWLDAWHVSPSSNADYNLIDGLRGIAILLVVVCHLVYVNPHAEPITHFIGGFFNAGGYGVPIFFGLSGFLISWPFWNRKVKGNPAAVPNGYGWRRFWKIYPPLVASILVFAPIYIFRTGDWNYAWGAAQWISGLSFLLPVFGKLNPVMWSLVVEIQFYIVIPLVFVCLKWVSAKRCLWIITGCFLVIPNVFRWCAYGGQGPAFYPMINSYFPTGLDAFAFGILMAGMESLGLTRRGWAKLGNIGFFLLFMTLLAGGWFAVHPPSAVQKEVCRWAVQCAAGLMLCYVADPKYPVSRWLCAAPLRWFGIVSYELYLVHQPIMLWGRSSFGPCDGSAVKYIALLGGTFVTSVVIAALLYKKFSMPILKAGRKKHIHYHTAQPTMAP